MNSGPEGVEYRLPFQNLRYKASVRVVDFFPPRLEDFAVAYNPEYAMLSDAESDEDSSMGQQRWEWRFCLLVEDGGPNARYKKGENRDRLKLFVAGQDAVFLLGIDAVK